MDAVDLDDPLVGTVLGKDYRVIEPIGDGGMAIVYLVEHQTLHKQFAAKVLSVKLAANLEARARFTEEAHAASQLDHENIVGISDFGVSSDARPFFVMELLRGQTLGGRLADGPMSLEEIIAVTVPVARALQYAHAEGIVHRDVKPENIFLVQRSHGRWGVKVVDFGIAKTPGGAHLTTRGETLGSPMYMAPEACRGEDVDHRADIYSFGILLYQMLCGRLPFEDENLQTVMEMQVTAPLPPPRSANPALQPELAAVIKRALEKDPDGRYQSMEALLTALDAATPPGADCLLLEMRAGVIGMRNTPFPSGTTQIPRSREVSSSVTPIVAPKPSDARVAAPTMPSAPRSRRWGALAILLGLVAVAAGLLFVVMRKDAGREQRTATGGSSTTSPSTAPVASVTPDAPSAPTQEEPPPPASVPLHIVSRPAGALVKLDGRTLGKTPLEINVEQLTATARLSLTKDGHDEVSQDIDLSIGASVDLVLPRTRVISTRPPIRKRPPTEDPKPTDAGSAAKPKGDPSLDIRLSR